MNGVMWMPYDGKHEHLDYDLGLLIFSWLFLDWIYHKFSLIFTIPLCPLQFMQQATNYLSPFYPTSVIYWGLALPLCSWRQQDLLTSLLDRLNLHYLFLNNINIFDSRQQCFWMYQNIMALKCSSAVQRSNRHNLNYYRGALWQHY